MLVSTRSQSKIGHNSTNSVSLLYTLQQSPDVKNMYYLPLAVMFVAILNGFFTMLFLFLWCFLKHIPRHRRTPILFVLHSFIYVEYMWKQCGISTSLSLCERVRIDFIRNCKMCSIRLRFGICSVHRVCNRNCNVDNGQ